VSIFLNTENTEEGSDTEKVYMNSSMPSVSSEVSVLKFFKTLNKTENTEDTEKGKVVFPCPQCIQRFPCLSFYNAEEYREHRRH